MVAPNETPIHRRRHFRRLRSLPALFRDARGATAVEIGIIAPIFILLIGFWMELGLTIMMQVTLDNATRDASRLIRIGTIQTSGSASTFKTQLCSELASGLVPCASVTYSVQSASSFSSISTAVTTDSSGNMTSKGFSPGDAGDDVVVQVAYARTFLVPLVSKFFTSGRVLILSTVVFRNEPY